MALQHPQLESSIFKMTREILDNILTFISHYTPCFSIHIKLEHSLLSIFIPLHSLFHQSPTPNSRPILNVTYFMQPLIVPKQLVVYSCVLQYFIHSSTVVFIIPHCNFLFFCLSPTEVSNSLLWSLLSINSYLTKCTCMSLDLWKNITLRLSSVFVYFHTVV